jgi:uncharacterized protein
MQSFTSTILIVPGLGNSGDGHWQTIWQDTFGFERIVQKEWEKPIASDWIDTIQHAVDKHAHDSLILVGHSLGCNTIVKWAAQNDKKIKGALLVAPSDTEAPSYPAGTTGFTPMPAFRLPFPSITIASSNDPFVSIDRAKYFAALWGSKLVEVGPAGHINVASGHGDWNEGLSYLRQLDAFKKD